MFLHMMFTQLLQKIFKEKLSQLTAQRRQPVTSRTEKKSGHVIIPLVL